MATLNSVSFQCPDSGLDVVMIYERGRLSGDHSVAHANACDGTDAERAAIVADTEAWIKDVAGRYASRDAARLALIRAGCDADDVADWED